jgi:CheY-like chemotaxis protein
MDNRTSAYLMEEGVSICREVIEAIFGFSLFLNAILFIPQIICIIKEKSVTGIKHILGDIEANKVGKKPLIAEHAPRILLVEDNPLIQHVTQSLLSDSGFEVDVAATGAEALEKFAANKYDLVYMDIGLPDKDGYAVTQALRQHEQLSGATSAIPVIALTAHGAMDVETFCTRAGMQGVVSKPLTRQQAGEIWKKFGLGNKKDLSGLTAIPPAEIVPLERQIVDMDGTVALLGSREYAKELLGLWYEMLTYRFLPALDDFIVKQDYEALRHELHTMLGSLCYVKTPLLNQAVFELQTAARSHPNNIAPAYEHVLHESQRFIKYYQQTVIV